MDSEVSFSFSTIHLMVISRMAFIYTQLSVGLYLSSYPVRKVEFLELLLYFFFRKVKYHLTSYLIMKLALFSILSGIVPQPIPQNKIRVITLNVYKVIRILSLPVGEVQSYFTSAEILQDWFWLKEVTF